MTNGFIGKKTRWNQASELAVGGGEAWRERQILNRFMSYDMLRNTSILALLRKVLIIVFLNANFCSFAYGNVGRLGVVSQGWCSNDLNPWRKPSHCECHGEALYSFKSGLCLIGFSYDVRLEGVFRISDANPTQVDFETYQGTFLLFLSDSMLELMKKAQDSDVEIEGEAIVIAGSEVPMKRAIIVETVRFF